MPPRKRGGPFFGAVLCAGAGYDLLNSIVARVSTEARFDFVGKVECGWG